MTLILSCITRDHVVQVSDRRLSLLDGTLFDDESNKAVVYCGLLAMAYTGFAQLGPSMPGVPENRQWGLPAVAAGPRTDWWIAQLLSEAPDLPAGLQRLAEATTRELAKIRLPLDRKPQAFVGVGWGRRRATPDVLRPSILLVANCTDPGGQMIPPTNEVKTTLLGLGRRIRYRWVATGQALTREEEVKLDRAIRRSVAKRREPAVIASLLAQTIRDVSMRNKAVGQSLMVVAIPKKAVPVEEIASGRPEADQATFAYLASADAEEALYYGPNVACAGFVMAGDILRLGPGPLASP